MDEESESSLNGLHANENRWATGRGRLDARPAAAQSDPLIDINVVLKNFLNELDLDVGIDLENVVVQVPVNVAANVCGVSVAVLTEQASTGDATCTVVNVSEPTVVQAVQQEVAEQTGGDGDGDGESEDCPTAKQAAPGQQKKSGEAETAKEAAPGQQPGAAKESAPGQMAKDCPEKAPSS